MKNVIIILLALIVVIFVITLFPIKKDGSSLLRKCEFRFDETTGGGRDVCYWIWDNKQRQPSIYF